LTASALYRQTGIGLSLVAIGGYCAVKLRELVAYAHHIGKNVIGVYSESHAARQQNQEALTYLRRPEG
jgi:hypothetical protein